MRGDGLVVWRATVRFEHSFTFPLLTFDSTVCVYVVFASVHRVYTEFGGFIVVVGFTLLELETRSSLPQAGSPNNISTTHCVAYF